jgi:hypothetical protein
VSVPGGASTSAWRRWRPGRFVLVLLAFYAYAALIAVGFTAHTRWTAPTWRRTIAWHGMDLSVPVPLALRLATTPRGVEWLAGRHVDAPFGRVEFARESGTGRLVAACAPCRFSAPAFGEAPIDVRSATLTVARVDDHLAGELRFDGIAIGWHGWLTDAGLRVHFALPQTPLAQALRAFADAVPEVQFARIDGTVALAGEAAWPGGDVVVEPTFRGLRVAGLGTERLHAPITVAGCRARPRIGSGLAWRQLGAAVVAAEDSRYYEHPGYDVDAMRLTLARNAADRRIAGGASTITQQLARIVYTGADRDVPRKLRELLYAVEMERTLGKAQILDLYLAMAPWGSGGCGAQAAARALYSRPIDELGPSELARLAAGLRDDERWRDTDAVVRIVREMRTITRTERRAAIEKLCAGSVSAECEVRELWAAK